MGERLPTHRAIHERLPKYLALPVFASDAVSSSAYATEEILIALALAGAAGLTRAWPVAAAIALLFAMVAISYRQTVLAYPSGGGAYIVAHENLGVNALGALATGVVLVVVASAKFIHGAWIVMLVVPALVYTFLRISHHYQGLAAALSAEGYTPPRAIRHAVIVLVPGIHKGVLTALRYAQTIAPEVEAVFVEIDPKETARLQQQWRDLRPGVPLTILKSPWRSLAEPIIHYTRTLRAEKEIEFVTVVIPEFVITHWWHRVLHNQSGLMLKVALMWEPGIVVTNVRYRPEPPGAESSPPE
jgi:hypothetical protein